MRFEDVTNDVNDVMKEVIDEYFHEFTSVKIKCLFDLKKRTSNGKIVLGRCQKTNDLLKHFTIDEANNGEGYHYIIYLDKLAWENIEKEDKIRLMRHELRHIYIDIDSDRNPYKLVGHDIEDFSEEIELNKDDVRWAQRVVGIVETLYDEEW